MKYVQSWTYFTPYSSVSIANFERGIAGWAEYSLANNLSLFCLTPVFVLSTENVSLIQDKNSSCKYRENIPIYLNSFPAE